MSADLRVVVSHDGELACLVEPRQVLVFALPSLDRIAEVGIDEGTEVALAGDPVRLAVVVPGGTMHLVDPSGKDGPEKVADLDLDPGTRILAASGDHVLVSSAAGIAVAKLVDRPAFARLPSRNALGGAGPGTQPDHFVLLNGGALEEWSAITRAPMRRFRLDRPIAARHVGGTARHVWFVPEATPTQLVLLPVGAGRQVQIDLPEPALRAAADPAGNHLAFVGATTRAVFLVALADRAVTQIRAGKVDDVAWSGGAVLCACDGQIEIVDVGRANGQEARPEPPEVAPAAQPTTQDRLAAWKQRMAARDPEPRVADQELTPLHEWRDALARWGRRILAGAEADPPLLAAGPLYDVGHRLGLIDDDATMLWLIYAARLCGHDGVAPADLVEVCPRRWDDALGRSKVADTGAFIWRHARVGLAPEIAAALDELPPLHGTSIASAIDLKRTVAIQAREIDLPTLGAWAAPRVGSLLVPTPRGLARPTRFLLEARARGLAPLIPWGKFDPPLEMPEDPSVIVVEDPAQTAIPVTLTWGTD